MAEAETADQLRAKIVAARARREHENRRTVELVREVEEAAERQRLRDELKAIETGIATQRTINSYHSSFKDSVDADEEDGWDHQEDFHPEGLGTGNMIIHGKGRGKGGLDVSVTKAGSSVCCNHDIQKGSFEWKIHGMSWLVSSLEFDSDTFTWSDDFRCGDYNFDLIYNPTGEVMVWNFESIAQKQWCSLAIRETGDSGIMFRYKFFIKAASGEFVQWGDEGNVCEPHQNRQCHVFGPDAQAHTPIYPIGIFGLKHSDLIESEWVQNDTLHVKVDVDVKMRQSSGWAPGTYAKHEEVHASVEVPPGNLHEDMLSLLRSGSRSDVMFVVEGERIKGHANILSARTHVLAKLFDCGMNESASKEIVIEDCDADVFKAFLKFLYTDNLEGVAEELRINNASGETEETCRVLLNLLSVSHKYQVVRLQCWCEQRLMVFMSVKAVCDILCQAHLHEATSLEKCCLAFIKDHIEKVASTAEFGSLAASWPEVMIKINVYLSGLAEEKAAEALQEARRKRQKLRSDA